MRIYRALGLGGFGLHGLRCGVVASAHAHLEKARESSGDSTGDY